MDVAKNREVFWKKIGKRFYVKNLTKAGIFRTPFIANMMKINGVNSVLELGCNVGRNLAEICKQCPDARVVGFDIAADAMKYAKEVQKNPAEFIVGSVYDLSRFEDNSFDVAFTSSILFHIPSEKIPPIIAEMKRIAKRFIFTIERHSEKEEIAIWLDKIPHQWRTDYGKAYKAVGLKPHIKKMEVVLPKQKVGGATHIIYAKLSEEEEEFKIR